MRPLFPHLATYALCGSLAFWAGHRQAISSPAEAPGKHPAAKVSLKPPKPTPAPTPNPFVGVSTDDLKARLMETLSKDGWIDPGNRVFMGQLEELIRRDPRSAHEIYSLAVKNDFDRYGYCAETLFRALARVDAKEAQRLALALLPKGEERAMKALGAVFLAMAETNPETAMRAALENPSATSPQFWSYFGTAAGINKPAALAAQLDLIPPGKSRQGFINSLGWNWLANDPDAFCAWYRTLSVQDAFAMNRRAPNTSFMTRDIWNVATTLRVWEALPDNALRRQLPGFVGSSVMGSGPDHLRSELASLAQARDPAAAEAIRKKLMENYTRWADPAEAALFIGTLPNSEQGGMAKLLGQQWAEKNATAALDWATSLPPGELRTEAVLGLLEVNYKLPAGGAQKLFQHAPEILGADESGRMVWQLVNGGVEPAEFLPHLATVEKPEQRDRLAGLLAESWAEQDAYACADWISTLPEGKGRDKATTTLAQKLSANNPPAALRWLATVKDETARTSTSEKILREWAERSPEAATDWLDANR